jgi:hypothetical protein
MNFIYKAGVALVAAAGFFFGGYFYRGQTPPQIITKTEIKEVEKVVTKTVIVKETKPDGTTTTTETTEVEKDKTSVTDKDKTTKPLSPVSPGVHLRYSVGVNWTPKIDADVYKPTGITAARRLGDTNMWGTSGYDWNTKAMSVGLRVDF